MRITEGRLRESRGSNPPSWREQQFGDDRGAWKVGDLHDYASDRYNLRTILVRDLEENNLDSSEQTTSDADHDAYVSRALASDTEFPILVIRYPDGLWIADGTHRTWKARELGQRALRGWILDWEEILDVPHGPPRGESESKLRQLIKEAITTADSRRAIAIFRMSSIGGICVIAYDIDELESIARGTYSHPLGDYNGVIAGVVLSDGKGHRQFEGANVGECHGSFQVQRAASNEKGWGIKVYLAALDYLEVIASDRFSVTPAAEGVWKKLANYGFVEQEPFDDIRDPQTPPTRDDCQMHTGRDPALNSAWRITGPIPADVKSLMAVGEEHRDELEQARLYSIAVRCLCSGFKKLFDD